MKIIKFNSLIHDLHSLYHFQFIVDNLEKQLSQQNVFLKKIAEKLFITTNDIFKFSKDFPLVAEEKFKEINTKLQTCPQFKEQLIISLLFL